MKKVLFLFAMCAMATVATAQTIGAKAGVNLNSMSVSLGDDAPDGAEAGDNPSGMGFHVGAYAQIEITDMLNFRPELLLDIRKISDDFETSSDFGGVSSTTKTETDASNTYLALPLLAEYKANDNLAFHLGPTLGFLMGAKSEYSSETTSTVLGETTTTSSSGESDSTDGLKGMDLGLGIGGTYAMESGLNFGLRYHLGLADTNDEKSGEDFSNNKWNAFQISVGYAFMRP